MTNHNIVDNYSLRILSPFCGTARVLQQQSIRAISNNGVNWRIQIQTSTDTAEEVNRYALYGLWTRSEGLKEFTSYPSSSSHQHRQLANDFAQQLPDRLDNLSFPPRDNMECWLLDKEQQPLALLIACQADQQLPRIRQPTWLPCAPDNHTFISPYLQQHPQPFDHSTAPTFHHDLISRQVHLAAGQNHKIQWFHRQPDGGGIGQSEYHDDQLLATRHLPAKAFPHFLIRQHWESEHEQLFIDDFFHWQSPWLLTLPNLNENERLQLELQACTYPQRLHALYHLYPVLLQKELINKTLIQAKLKMAAPYSEE